MTLTTAEKWKIGGAVTLVILICAGLAVHSLLAAHDATLKASAASQVRAEVEKQADASIATRSCCAGIRRTAESWRICTRGGRRSLYFGGPRKPL
jgi:hypothetical protein